VHRLGSTGSADGSTVYTRRGGNGGFEDITLALFRAQAASARHAFDVLGLALADFDSRDHQALMMDAAARAARPAADP
jgi:hypothetical protein